MRLRVSFVGLLLATATAASLIWANMSAARDGDDGARLIVLSAAPVLVIATLLAARVVVKTATDTRRGKE